MHREAFADWEREFMKISKKRLREIEAEELERARIRSQIERGVKPKQRRKTNWFRVFLASGFIAVCLLLLVVIAVSSSDLIQSDPAIHDRLSADSHRSQPPVTAPLLSLDRTKSLEELTELIERTKSTDPQVRAIAVGDLWETKGHDELRFDRCVELMADSDERVWRMAMVTVSDIAESNPEITVEHLSSLLALLDDSERAMPIRFSVLTMIGDCGDRAASITEELVLRSQNPVVPESLREFSAIVAQHIEQPMSSRAWSEAKLRAAIAGAE